MLVFRPETLRCVSPGMSIRPPNPPFGMECIDGILADIERGLSAQEISQRPYRAASDFHCQAVF